MASLPHTEPILRRTPSRRPQSRYLSEYYEDNGYPVVPGSADAVENAMNSTTPEEAAAEDAKGQAALDALEDWLCDLDLHYDSATYRCIMVGCPEERFATPEEMLAHLNVCDLFPDGKYRCPTALPPTGSRSKKSSKFTRAARKVFDIFRRPVSKQTQCSKCGWPLKPAGDGYATQYHEEWTHIPSVYSASSAGGSPRRPSFCSDGENTTARGSMSTAPSTRAAMSNASSPAPSPRPIETNLMPGPNVKPAPASPMSPTSPLDELKPLPDLRHRASKSNLHRKRNSMPAVPSLQRGASLSSHPVNVPGNDSPGLPGQPRQRAGTWDAANKRNSVAVTTNPQARPQRRPSQRAPAHHRHTIGGTSPTKPVAPTIDFAKELERAKETVRPADTRMSMACFDADMTLMMGMMEYNPATDGYSYDGNGPRPEELGEMDLHFDFSEKFGNLRRSMTGRKRSSLGGGQSSKRSSYMEVEMMRRRDDDDDDQRCPHHYTLIPFVTIIAIFVLDIPFA